jgi:hypothetical protein
VKVAWIYKDELVEKKLKMGNVIHIDAGSTFHMVNTGKGQTPTTVSASALLIRSVAHARCLENSFHPQPKLVKPLMQL